jgi:hypothetical protein
MTLPALSQARKPRELRRRVMLRARLRAAAGWSDACILNVSSRGLMINAAGAASPQKGSTIEIWHGGHVIVAEVMWRKGTRAGLRSDQRVPVEEIMALSNAPSLQLTAGQWPQVERRKQPRSHDDSRLRSRAIEFTGVAVVVLCLAGGVLAMVQQALARPMAHVAAALGG